MTILTLKAPANQEAYAFGIRSTKLLSDLLTASKLKPGPIKLFPNGLASVKDGFEYMKSGKVRVRNALYSAYCLRIGNVKIG